MISSRQETKRNLAKVPAFFPDYKDQTNLQNQKNIRKRYKINILQYHYLRTVSLLVDEV